MTFTHEVNGPNFFFRFAIYWTGSFVCQVQEKCHERRILWSFWLCSAPSHANRAGRAFWIVLEQFVIYHFFLTFFF